MSKVAHIDGQPFVTAARAQTMLKDFNKLRKSIREWDPEQTEMAWEKCERWVSCLSAADPNATQDDVERMRALDGWMTAQMGEWK